MTKTILNKRQFAELYELSKGLFSEGLSKLPKDAPIEYVNQLHWMFNGAVELITHAYTDIKEDK